MSRLAVLVSLLSLTACRSDVPMPGCGVRSAECCEAPAAPCGANLTCRLESGLCDCLRVYHQPSDGGSRQMLGCFVAAPFCARAPWHLLGSRTVCWGAPAAVVVDGSDGLYVVAQPVADDQMWLDRDGRVLDKDTSRTAVAGQVPVVVVAGIVADPFPPETLTVM